MANGIIVEKHGRTTVIRPEGFSGTMLLDYVTGPFTRRRRPGVREALVAFGLAAVVASILFLI